MKFQLKWPFIKSTPEAKSATRSIVISDLDTSFVGCALNLEIITPLRAFNFYKYNSSVATAVDKVSSAFEQIQPVLISDTGDIIEEHEVLQLLKNPNPYMDGSGFKERYARHYLLTHESHLYMVGSSLR